VRSGLPPKVESSAKTPYSSQQMWISYWYWM
jgi:hypothetical protein